MTPATHRTEISFGFWSRSPKDTSGLPWPVVSVTPDAEFLERVARVEAEACEVERYRGMSWSRLTGKLLGSHEFVLTDTANGSEVRWPGDYATHYLAAGVAPDPGFVSLIDRTHATLPSHGPGQRS